MELKELFSELSRQLDSMDNWKDVHSALSTHLKSEHRSLQQCFMRDIVLVAIKEFASRENCDFRNVGTVRLAKILQKEIDKFGPLPYM